jgi:hypothetical protein
LLRSGCRKHPLLLDSNDLGTSIVDDEVEVMRDAR